MKTTGMISLLLAVAGAAITAPAVTYAGTVVYEPFNYPSLSDGTIFASSGSGGVTTAANAQGLTGSYVATTSWPGVHDAIYDTSGPGFSGMQATGGAVTVSAPTNGSGSTDLSVQLAPGATLSGNTLYGSYLFDPGTTGASSMAFGISDASSGSYLPNAQFTINRNGGLYGFGQTGSDTGTGQVFSSTTNSGTVVSPGTTYLQLFEVTGVNATSGSVSMADWVLTDAQYQFFVANGGISAANLDANPSEVLQSGSATITSPTAYPQFNNGVGSGLGNYMVLAEYDTNTIYTDIRLSGTSLADVAPTPEPATLGLMAVAGAGLLLIGRRKVRGRV